MKRFQFPLDRVWAWRQTQARIEEAKLDRLRADLAQTQQRRLALAESVHAEQTALLAVRNTTGNELAALEHYRSAAARHQHQLTQSCLAIEKDIAAQTDVVAVRRREARLLERLRERRLTTWKADSAAEIEQAAADAYLARYRAATKSPATSTTQTRPSSR